MSDWLQKLKVGDEVAVMPPHDFRRACDALRMTVTHATVNFIDCGDVRFRRKDGLEVGYRSNFSADFHSLQGVWGAYSERSERSKIAERIRKEFIAWGSTGMKRPLDQLRRIVAILEEGKETK